ncbi:kama family protein [Mollisia scopiformis]|uniref:Kama family protein n=1 Tax=Mollisia scopiformis TaxID=149040 RepID=A0A132BA42_MOLSC|nr:kama family protein [Mollisia scopiformis]KUJ08537.1 kama family protein [Mollisia scopiformis]
MGSAGLAQAPLRQDSPDFTYDSHNNISPDDQRGSAVPVTKATQDIKEVISNPTIPRAALNIQDERQNLAASVHPAYFRGSKFDRVPYWQRIHRWEDIGEREFLSYRWNTAKDVQGKEKLYYFLKEELPEKMPDTPEYEHTRTRDAFLEDVIRGIDLAPMSIRLTPHILASINWNDPLNDPLSRQFIPKKSTFQPDHPKLELDSLHESDDSPVEGLVHRYTDKCLFLASSHCPLYCRFCTRSYAVGADTETVTKAALKPARRRWEAMLDYIAATPVIQDVVLSGGDSYSLMPQHLAIIGSRLLEIPHVRRFRVATKGLCVSPSRTLDPNDDWTEELIKLSKEARLRGKHVAMHTHFNHPNEFSWVSREAAQKLYANGVTVRNQSVLLKGVNDDIDTMKGLIRELADNNIQPYYVYAGDLVKGVEDLRTPLSTILDLETQIRGSIAGFMTPQFVVDLPGGGGKRLAASYKTYDRATGRSTFVAPAVHGKNKEGRLYEYYDPLASLPNGGESVDFAAIEHIVI